MEIYSLTDIGMKREMNQDYFFTSEEPIGNLPNLFIVADGMGGHNAGEFASRFVVETVVDVVKKSEKTEAADIIRDAVSYANRSLLEQAHIHEEMQGMGTTIVASTLQDGQLLVANVGDSRLYVAGKQLRQITKDHSLVQEMVRMGEIDEERARNHPDKNIITRAVGADKDINIDFFEVPLEAGDQVVMCSDGLTNMIRDEDLFDILKNKESSLPEKVETLVEIANNNGGLDNITVIVFEPIQMRC